MPHVRAMLAAATAASTLSGASSFLFAPVHQLCGAMTRSSFVDPSSLLLCAPSFVRTTTTTATFKNGGSRMRGRSAGRCSMLSEEEAGEGKFIRMGGAEDAQIFGPRCILASGLKVEEFRAARSILEEDQDQLGATPLVLLTPEIADDRVGDVLTDAAAISSRQDEDVGGERLEGASPVILISGFTNTELRGFASRFRSATGVRAAFAKAVPNAMVKSAASVCGEIAQDHADALAGKLHD